MKAPPRRHARGQASMEYLVVCAALAMALYLPLQDGNSPQQPKSTIDLLLEAFRSAYEKYGYALSLPQ